MESLAITNLIVVVLPVAAVTQPINDRAMALIHGMPSSGACELARGGNKGDGLTDGCALDRAPVDRPCDLPASDRSTDGNGGETLGQCAMAACDPFVDLVSGIQTRCVMILRAGGKIQGSGSVLSMASFVAYLH